MKLKKLIACGGVLFGLVLFSQNAYAYNDTTTHPALTNEIVSFYNLTHPSNQFTDEERSWLIEGSRLEDTPPRWINHFYDPVHKVAWTGEKEGVLPAELVQILSRFGLSQQEPLSTLSWVKSDTQGIEYSRYGGDWTWGKAVDAYLSEDKRTAYIALGHILHLLEDMAVPDHTRNDTHASIIGIDGSSPYESYATQFDINGIKRLNIATNLKNANAKEIGGATIEASLASLAEYSNKYFFSKDTINDPKFDSPKIVEEKNGFGYGIDEVGKEFLLVRAISELRNGKSESAYSLESLPVHKPILNAYFLRLSKQVVLRGAGLIDMFYAGMEDARIARDIPQHLYKVDRSVFTFPSFSIFGELSNFGNSIGNFVTGLIRKPSTQNASDSLDSAAQLSEADTPIIPEGDTFSYGDEAESPTIVAPISASALQDAEELSAEIPALKSATTTPTSTKPVEKQVAKTVAKNIYSGGGATGSTQILRCVAGGVTLTEIMYDAPGSDDGKEWVEIYNSGVSNIAVPDMKLSEGGTNHSIKSSRGLEELASNAYAIIANDANQFSSDHPEYLGQIFYSAFSLSNDGENIALKCGDSVLDSITYSTSTGARGDGKSLQVRDAVWRAASPTPGRATTQSQLPYAAFSYMSAYPKVGESVSFSAASSTAGVGKIISYAWDFGDGASASSTDATSTHTYAEAKTFEVALMVTDEAGATSSKTASIDISPNVPSGTNHIVISEVQVSGARPDDEFIELYNPTSAQISLAGYSIQYLSGKATSTEKISKKNFDDAAVVQPHGFYLLAKLSATSSLKDGADMKYSFSLSGDLAGGIIFLSDKNIPLSSVSDSSIVDSVAYGAVALSGISTSTLPISEKSLERKASANSTIATMINGEDEFAGNSYDTDNNATDFIIRDIPKPQNSQNYPEGRATPTAPAGPDGATSTIGRYDVASSSIAFSWKESKDFADSTSSIIYKLYAIDTASSSLLMEAAATAYLMSVSGENHLYEFGLRACDREGLCSATSSFSVLVRKNSAPLPAFSFSPASPRLGDVVSFDAAPSTDSDGTIVSYEWNFDDGIVATSTGVINTHSFEIVGTHNITLLVKDNEGATSSTSTTVIIAPKLEMTTSTFMLSQENFDGGAVANVGYQSGTQFQYLGTGLVGTINSISVYMMQNNYGGSPTSLTLRLFASEAFDATPRVIVADVYNPRSLDGAWGIVGLNYALNPNKHYWLGVSSDSTGYLNQIPAKSLSSARYPYDARYIFGYIDTFTGGAFYRDNIAENASLAYRVSGTLP